MYEFEKFEITKLSGNTSVKQWGKFTDQLLVLKQGRDIITLGKKELEELEKVIGAKFRQ